LPAVRRLLPGDTALPRLGQPAGLPVGNPQARRHVPASDHLQFLRRVTCRPVCSAAVSTPLWNRRAFQSGVETAALQGNNPPDFRPPTPHTPSQNNRSRPTATACCPRPPRSAARRGSSPSP